MSIASTAIWIGQSLLEGREAVLTDKTRTYIAERVCTIDRDDVGNVDLIYMRPMMGSASDYPEYITLKHLLDLFFDGVFKYSPL